VVTLVSTCPLNGRAVAGEKSQSSAICASRATAIPRRSCALCGRSPAPSVEAHGWSGDRVAIGLGSANRRQPRSRQRWSPSGWSHNPKHFQRPAPSHFPVARSASSETKRSGRGEPPPRPEPEPGLPIFARPNLVRVTTPHVPMTAPYFYVPSSDGPARGAALRAGSRAFCGAPTPRVPSLAELLVGLSQPDLNICVNCHPIASGVLPSAPSKQPWEYCDEGGGNEYLAEFR
jgi:hypothetical protein